MCLCVGNAESPLMRDEKQPLGGAVVVTVDSGTVGRLDVEVLWAHTTDSMCLGYMSTADQQAKVQTLSTHISFILHSSSFDFTLHVQLFCQLTSSVFYTVADCEVRGYLGLF